MITWTENEKALNRKAEVNITHSGIKEEVFDDRGLPSDTHIVNYEIDGETHCDAVRANRMCDIFDVYYDKLQEYRGKVIAIKNGYGTIKPRLWQAQKEVDGKKG